jgi:ATP-dependent Lhr-like helicase
LTDLSRITLLLRRAKGRLTHMALSRVSPLAVPVLLEIGRESIQDRMSEDELLAETEILVAEATGLAEPPPFRPHAATPRRERPRQGRLL